MQAKLSESAEEVERLRIEGEQHIMKLNDTIQNKELQVSDLLEKFQNERNFGFEALFSGTGGFVGIFLDVNLNNPLLIGRGQTTLPRYL